MLSLNRSVFSRDITWMVDQKSLDHWRKLPRDSAVFVAVKHAHYTDHYSVAQLAWQLGRKCYYVSIPETFEEFWGMAGFVARRMGGFAVERGGTNIQATRYIVETLLKGERPFVIFPEGELYFLNDIVTPIKPGLALFALEGAKARQKAQKPNSSFILPIALKYVYPYDATSLLEEKLGNCEKKLFGSVKKGVILQRTLSLAEALLAKASSEFEAKVTGNGVEEKFLSLSRILVDRLETQEYGKQFEGDLSDRARRLMTHCKDKKESFHVAYWGLHSLAFYPGYLNQMSQERLMEMLRKLERLITGEEHVSFPGDRNLMIQIQPPIAVDSYLPDYLSRATKRDAMTHLTQAVQSSMQQGIDHLCEEISKLRKSESPRMEKTAR